MLETTSRFLSELQGADDLDEVWGALSGLARGLGFDWALLASLPARPRTPDPALADWRTDLPGTALEDYLGSGLVGADPLFRRTIRSDRPVAVHLEELRRSLPAGRARELLGLPLVRDFPLRMTLPAVAGGGGTCWGFAVGGSIAERDAGALLREAAPALWLASAAAVLRISPPEGEGAATDGPLSPRERECLLRLAQGERVDRIAERLGLSNATVEMHLANARRHLGARTSAEAVARAVLRGWIRP